MITTTSSLPAPVQQVFNRRLLAVKTPNLIHNIPAMEYVKPKQGTTIRFRRYTKLNTAKVPLGNTGATPPGQQLTAVNIDAKMDFYGTYVRINEQVTLQAQDPVLNEAAKLLGYSLRETEDELTRDVLAATAAAVNAVGGVNGDNPTEITRDDVADITRTLLRNSARTLIGNIEGEDRFGTGPIRSSYMALCHSDMSKDLEKVSGFIHKDNYPFPDKALEAEWGSIGNLRFMLSEIGSISSAASNMGRDVYNIFCLGREAVGRVAQDGYNAQFVYRDPMYSGPLAQNVTVGYKTAQVSRILNDQWIMNLRTTMSTN